MTGEPELFGEGLTPVPICPTQIPHRPAWDGNRISTGH